MSGRVYSYQKTPTSKEETGHMTQLDVVVVTVCDCIMRHEGTQANEVEVC